MGAFQDFLILFSFLVEVGVLFYLEKKAWNTLYTPLNFLMLPYLAVLLVSIAISGKSGFVEFYYPSILLWSVGLLLFAIPDLSLAIASRKTAVSSGGAFAAANDIDDTIPPVFTYIGIALVLMFAYRLRQTIGSSAYIIGSDDFAEEFAGFGFWGHLKRFSSVMLMIYIYYLNRNQKWLWVFIIALMGVSVINMVKGTMIIPCVVGVMMRLASGRMKITWRFIAILLLSSVAVFFVTFLIAIVVVNEMEVDGQVILYIFQRFVHYFTSGTLGLSMDMELNFPDRGNFDIIMAPFINIINQVTGNSEIISPVNPVYHFTGISLTNVRTVFGTLFIYTGYLQFALYVMGLSLFCYFLKILGDRFPNVFTNLIYYYFCALLAMGWFEFYFFHLDIIEIPVMIILLHIIDWTLVGRTHGIQAVAGTVN